MQGEIAVERFFQARVNSFIVKFQSKIIAAIDRSPIRLTRYRVDRLDLRRWGAFLLFFLIKKKSVKLAAFRIGLAVLNELATISVLTVPQNS